MFGRLNILLLKFMSFERMRIEVREVYKCQLVGSGKPTTVLDSGTRSMIPTIYQIDEDADVEMELETKVW